jgi:hypothetical protein
MTALTMAARPRDDATPRPLPWRRMAWVTWRQHRFTLAAVALFLGGLAVGLWVVGRRLHHAYALAAACHPSSSPVCDNLITSFAGMDSFLANGWVLHAVPPVIGAFVGAPVLARELETGTFRYAWTQGFGRWRWALAKLVPLAIMVATAAGALSVLLSWYYRPYLANRNLFLPEVSPLSSGLFDLRGIAFAGWTLAAFAIGALAGMLIRRLVPAIAATLAVYAGLAFAAGAYLRHHYLAPLIAKNVFDAPASTLVVSRWWSKAGVTVSQSKFDQQINAMFFRLLPTAHGADGKAKKLHTNLNVMHDLTQHGYTQWTRYQPASRFWSFQLIEAGWLLTLSLLLIGATVWLVHRRAA